MTDQGEKEARGLRVYVAGPLSRGDTAGNVRAAISAAGELVTLGHLPYVPHLTILWHLVQPRPYEEWMRLDLAWLAVCDALVRLPGDSLGAEVEVERAHELGIPVYLSVEGLVSGRDSRLHPDPGPTRAPYLGEVDVDAPFAPRPSTGGRVIRRLLERVLAEQAKQAEQIGWLASEMELLDESASEEEDAAHGRRD